MGVARIARAFTGKEVEPEAELVVWLNGVVAIGAGAVCWVKFDLSLGAALGLTVALFVALLASLLHPYAAIVAGILGSAVAAGIGGLIGAALGLRFGGTAAAWGCGVVVAAGLSIAAASAYRKLVGVFLAARQSERMGSP